MPTAPRKHNQRERLRGTKTERGYGGEWSRISRLYRAQHSVCEICNDAVADDVDHIIPFRSVTDPRRTDWANLQAVCRPCHIEKTRTQYVHD